MNVPFGERLKVLRKQRNLSLRQVADEIGVSKSSYAGYEKNYRHPPLDKLLVLSDFFQAPIDYILCKIDDPNSMKYNNNAKEYLRNKGLHWDGIPLTDKDLQEIGEWMEKSLSTRTEQVNT